MTTGYWRPEPRLNDGTFYALLVPACVYVAGVIVYGAEAMKAGAFTWSQQGIGSALMVIGGEAGTLATAMEVFRKQRANEVAPLDWLGLFVSLVATLGALFVVFARQTTLPAGWVGVVRHYGPLALLLASGLDFYANVMELGFYRASFDARWTVWNDGRHSWEQARSTRREKEAQEQAKKSRERIEFAREMSKTRHVDSWSAFQVLKRDGWHCFYCSADMKGCASDEIHIDHFYPRSKGGEDDLQNLVVSCAQCNLKKNSRDPTPDEIRRFQLHLVRAAELEAKDKVVLLDRMGLLEQQKDIADQVGVSASYVSSLLRKAHGELSEPAAQLMTELATVGQPRDNGHKLEEVRV